MKNNDHQIDDLILLNGSLSNIISKAKKISEMSEHTLGHWENTCSILKNRLSNENIRIAVTGVLKSGKSTFLNSYLEGDYLEHGAGVVTSMVTKINSGKKPKAILTFKSINEINREIGQSIYSFSKDSVIDEGNNFDLRNENDRKKLKQSMEGLTLAQLVTKGTRNPQNALLPLYLSGYESVKHIITSDNTQIQYDGTEFFKYRSFISDETRSVYLKDIRLEIYSQNLDKNLEFGDCQGCDSLNPYHLMMIQDYLNVTHLIIYVVSSRSGLRQADIKFLSMLRKLGIHENIVYVINCDMDDHDTLENLTTLVEKTRKDLKLLVPKPKIYTFSCLFNFFHVFYEYLSEKDKLRFNQWESEVELSKFSKKEIERFNVDLKKVLKDRRYQLFLNDNLQRHTVIFAGLIEWLDIIKSTCQDHEKNENEFLKKFNLRLEQINNIRSMIKTILKSNIPLLKKELQLEIDQFFNLYKGKVFHKIIQSIKDYKVVYNDIEESIKGPGLLNTLNLIFQEFKQSLDLELVESVNPEVLHFVKKMEKKIAQFFLSIDDSFQAMIENHFANGNTRTPMQEEINSILNDHTYNIELGIKHSKNDPHINVPPLYTFARNSAKVKTEVMIRFGVFTIHGIIQKVFKQRLRNPNQDMYWILKAGVQRMKKETIQSTHDYLRKYKEYLKNNYIYRLVDHEARDIQNIISSRFAAYTSDLNDLIKSMSSDLSIRKENIKTVQELQAMLIPIEEKIKNIKKYKNPLFTHND